MGLLNYEYSEVTNFIAIRGYIELSKGVVATCEAYVNKTFTSYMNGSFQEVEHSIEDNAKSAIGNLSEKIKRYTGVVTTVTKHASELTELMQYCVEHIKYYTAKYLIKELQLIGMKLKAIILNIKMFIAKALRKILIAMANGLASAASSAFVMALIVKIQLIGQIIGIALTAINTLLTMLPPMITVQPQAMALFPTPKSLRKVDIVAINTNKSICNRLPEPVWVAIREATHIVDVINVPIKIAMVAACAASGIAQAKSKSHDFEIMGCKKLSLLDPEKVIKAIEFIVQLIPIPQALPKYEKISIINLGYLAWLLTSFELAGKQSFGMMGMP